MLLGLIGRGVCLRLSGRGSPKRPWNLGFGLGSLSATLAQGFIVGGLVGGFKVRGGYLPAGFGLAQPLAALVALGLLCLYLLLGATYLILKTEGEVQENAYRQAQVAAWALLIVAVGLGCWGLFKDPFWARRWLVWPSLWLTTCPIILAGLSFVLLLSSLLKANDRAPFGWSLAIFWLAFLAMAASLHPDVIPPADHRGRGRGPAPSPWPSCWRWWP